MNKIYTSFTKLGLKTPIINALADLGYTTPSPIQSVCIPYLLAGRDVLGIAHTGSGKTAAFALPLLHNIDFNLHFPQILILAPTRELAIQIGESCNKFIKYIQNINIVVLYGGQRYDIQFRALRQKKVHVIIGTPGRLLDHVQRGTLNLSYLRSLVLDEADEMLRMGFIEDVENILTKISIKHQTALFSATMPEAIRRITHRFMCSPKEIHIASHINTRPDINQNYWVVQKICKNEALIRFLEVEDFDAAIIFVRTKNATLEISAILEKNGYNSAALNGDMNQTLRETTLARFKDGKLDILIATDIASRGLDVDRINLVINYDIPIDSKSYIHRIGRTGRAGRTGKAILFVEHYERKLLRNIERINKLHIPEIKLPTLEALNTRRLIKFSEKIKYQLKSKDLDIYDKLLTQLQLKETIDLKTLAVVLLKIAQENFPIILPSSDTIIQSSSISEQRNSNIKIYHNRQRNRSYIKSF